MKYDNLIFEKAEGVAVLRLNRPAAFNALDTGLFEDIVRALEVCAVDEGGMRPATAAFLYSRPGGKCSDEECVVNPQSAGYAREFCFDQKRQYNPFPSFLLILVDLLTELLSASQVDELSCPGIK